MSATGFALIFVAAAGLFLFALGFTALCAPVHAKRFFLGFAATRQRHFIELLIRSAAGLAFITASPKLPMPALFFSAGALLLATTAIMAVLPFRLHQSFAAHSVPRALSFLPAIGLASIVAGVATMWSAYAASAA